MRIQFLSLKQYWSQVSLAKFQLSVFTYILPEQKKVSRVVIGMEWKESKTDCPGVILWGMRLRRNCWNISMNRNSYPLKYQSLSLSCSHGFKRQHCMWVVSTINHGPHHKNKCCTSAGDGQQRDITMVIEKAIMNKIDTFFKELDQRITVERGSFEFLFWFFVSYPSWLVIFSLALLCKQISWAALDVDRCFEQLSQMAA